MKLNVNITLICKKRHVRDRENEMENEMENELKYEMKWKIDKRQKMMPDYASQQGIQVRSS